MLSILLQAENIGARRRYRQRRQLARVVGVCDRARLLQQPEFGLVLDFEQCKGSILMQLITIARESNLLIRFSTLKVAIRSDIESAFACRRGRRQAGRRMRRPYENGIQSRPDRRNKTYPGTSHAPHSSTAKREWHSFGFKGRNVLRAAGMTTLLETDNDYPIFEIHTCRRRRARRAGDLCRWCGCSTSEPHL
jgi:hypothetical protein